MSDPNVNMESGSEQQDSKEKSFREWMLVAVGLTGLLSILAIVVSVVALSSKTPAPEPATTVTQAATSVTPPPPLAVKMTVKSDTEHGKKGPDGQWHDAFLGGDVTVKPGQSVTVTVMNYDDAAHSFNAPSLGVNAQIPGGGEKAPKETTFTFTAPKTPGQYQWFCAIPCDPWAMAHDGYMRGHVTVAA